jgi:drug/metabolite transporter (DMT)-like permease
MNEKEQSRHFLIGFACALAGTTLFSMKGILVKLSYQHGIDPVSLMLLRMGFSLPFYLMVIALERNHIKSTVTPRLLSIVIGLGVLGYCVASYLDLMGLERIGAGLERILLYTYPAMVMILSVVFLRKPVHPKMWVALAMVLSGLVLVLFFTGGGTTFTGSREEWIGVLLVLGSALSFSVYFIGTGEVTRTLTPRSYTAMAMLGASFAIVLLYLVDHSFRDIDDYPPAVYLYAALIAVFCTVIPSFLVAEGISRIGSSMAGITSGFGPVLTLVVAAMVLGETLNIFQIAGFVVVIAGIVVLGRLKPC